MHPRFSGRLAPITFDGFHRPAEDYRIEGPARYKTMTLATAEFIWRFILTKRPDRMAKVTATLPVLPNAWLGTSVESAGYLSRIDHLRQVKAAVRFISFEPLLGSVAEANLTGMHWAIVGGESGPRARPMAEQWVDEIDALCRQFGTAFFFKQWGGVRKKATGRLYRGEVFDAMPGVL